jgi:cytidylate kinase
MSIITISRQKGSLGDEIAKATADKLEYQYIEKSQISEVLSRLGFARSDIDKYDEKKPSVWQSLSLQKRLFALFIRAAVYELSARNNVIIAGRGGQVILQEIPDTLHVRVIAPFASRVSRLIEHEGYEEEDAYRLIRQSDKDSAGYLHTYFDADWDDGSLYDLVINTRSVTLEQAVEMIICGADVQGLSDINQLSGMLNNLALDQRANAVLLEVVGDEGVSLVVENGLASLSGLVESSIVKQNCEKAVKSIQGVSAVDNRISVLSKDTSVF